MAKKPVPEEKPATIVSFHAENIKRISAAQINPTENPIVVLTGKNSQGKSSVIDAIWMGLGGEKCIPGQPLKRGAETGYVTLDMGNYIVTRRFTKAGSYLEVKNKEGFKAAKPQEFLTSRLSPNARNPLEFLRLNPQRQYEILQDMIDFDFDQHKEEFMKVTGMIDETKPITKEKFTIHTLDVAYKRLYEERTGVNRDLKRAHETRGWLADETKDIPPDLTRVVVSDLMDERRQLESQRDARTDHLKMVEAEENRLEYLALSATNCQTKINELERQLREQQAFLTTLQQEHAKVRTTLEKLAEITPPEVDFEEIDKRLSEADAVNQQVNKLESLVAQEYSCNVLEEDLAEINQEMAALTAFKTKMIASVNLPVPGLTFQDGTVYLNGLPFDQASGSEQIKVSCAICMANHPRVGVLTLDVGWSELDSDSQTVLTDWAKETGAQIWVTKVQDSPSDDGFWILDGTVGIEEKEAGDEQTTD